MSYSPKYDDDFEVITNDKWIPTNMFNSTKQHILSPKKVTPIPIISNGFPSPKINAAPISPRIAVWSNPSVQPNSMSPKSEKHSISPRRQSRTSTRSFSSWRSHSLNCAKSVLTKVGDNMLFGNKKDIKPQQPPKTLPPKRSSSNPPPIQAQRPPQPTRSNSFFYPSRANKEKEGEKLENDRKQSTSQDGTKKSGGNRFLSALSLYTKVLKDDPTNTRILASRGMVYFMMGQLEEAKKDLNACLALDPYNFIAVSCLARLGEPINVKRPRAHSQPAIPKNDKMEEAAQILGVSTSDNSHEIRKAYRKACLMWHPDKWTTASKDQKEHAELMFNKVSNAYNTLKDRQTK